MLHGWFELPGGRGRQLLGMRFELRGVKERMVELEEDWRRGT
jgi:hypothetical protein